MLFLENLFSIKNDRFSIKEARSDIKFKRVTFLGLKLYFNPLNLLEFYWKDEFIKYFKQNDMKEKVKLLKVGLDDISCEYVDNFMRLSLLWKKGWGKDFYTSYDKKLKKDLSVFLETFKQPFANILKIDPLFFLNVYGLSDLPENVFASINGKAIIDGGGYTGDTAVMLQHYFPDSDIYVYEPLSVNIENINKILQKCENSNIIPIKKGLGDKKENIEIVFNDREMAEMTTINDDFKDISVGLIKLDVEGFESKIIAGAIELIKKQKPILAISIYHTPEDFFDMKSKIEKLNLGYKFMIRRSEMVLPQADLVLIAY